MYEGFVVCNWQKMADSKLNAAGQTLDSMQQDEL